jgi:hypothetical protein
MPNISQASVPVTNFPNKFISPFSDTAMVPLYSSIPFTAYKDPECLPCAVCGSFTDRVKVIQEQAAKFAGYTTKNEVFVGRA